MHGGCGMHSVVAMTYVTHHFDSKTDAATAAVQITFTGAIDLPAPSNRLLAVVHLSADPTKHGAWHSPGNRRHHCHTSAPMSHAAAAHAVLVVAPMTRSRPRHWTPVRLRGNSQPPEGVGEGVGGTLGPSDHRQPKSNGMTSRRPSCSGEDVGSSREKGERVKGMSVEGDVPAAAAVMARTHTATSAISIKGTHTHRILLRLAGWIGVCESTHWSMQHSSGHSGARRNK